MTRSAAGSASDAAGVGSARRAIELLEAFAAHSSWLSLSDLHALTGFPRSSLHGLRDAGRPEADTQGTRYRLGARALVRGTAYPDRDPAIPFATEALEVLRAELTREEVADPLPALTGNTLVSLEVLHEACAATRERGCAAEVEESAPGVRCVAAVVPCRLPGTDAISCSMPVDQTTDAQARETGEPLAEATTDLAHRLRRAGIR